MSIANLDDIFPAQRPRRLNAAEIERAATMDPTNGVNRGALRALRNRSTDPADPARPLLDALLAVPAEDGPPAPYVNPARVTMPPGAHDDKRPLTPADIEWLRRLPVDPAAVSDDDTATLARMVAQAASSSDLRLLAAHFEPIWRHHDVAEQQHERRIERQRAEAAKAVRSRTIEQHAVVALAAHVAEANPTLRESEARNRAAEQLRDRWADVDLALQSTIDANPNDTPTPRPMPGIEGLGDMAAGRERGQRARERREAEGDPFAGLPVVGG